MMSVLVELNKIDVTYQQKQVLSQISLTLCRGELTTIIGPNGAGKSTLIKIVLGLIQPSRGHVLRAKNITMGYVPQKLNLNNALPITVARFLKLNCSSNDIINETLAQLNITHLKAQAMHLLSGGEMQRVLLARALLNQPNLLVLDEPVQGVDVHGQVQLYELIQNLAEETGCTILLVSHDLHLVMARTDHVICLNKHICCHGKPQSVAMHPEFARLFGQREQQQLAVYTHHHTSHSENQPHA